MSLEAQLSRLNDNLEAIMQMMTRMPPAAVGDPMPPAASTAPEPAPEKPKAEKPKTAAKPAAEKPKAAPPPEPEAQAAVPEPAAASADPSVTFQDLVKALKNVAVAWMKIPGEDHVKRSADLFTGFGITKLMELPQEQWEAFMMKAAESAAEAEELAAA